MNAVSGVYKNGQVVLDRPVDWPNGAKVAVARGTAVAETPEKPETCVDGSEVQDSPEALQAWLEWFDSRQPVFNDEEFAAFQESLRSIRSSEAGLVSTWQKRIDHLTE